MLFAKNPSQNYSFFSSRLIWVNRMDPSAVEGENTLLYAGLSNVMNQLKKEGEKEKEEKCTNSLETLKRPIQNKNDFVIRVNNWAYLNESIEVLERKDITPHELRSLMIQAGIGTFADEILVEKQGDFKAEEVVSRVRETAVTTSESNVINLLNAAKEEEIIRTKATLIETKGIVENGLKDHLETEMKTVHGELDKLEKKKPQRLEPKTFKRLRGQLSQYHELIITPEQFKTFDKKELIGILNEIDTLNHDLETLDEEPDNADELSEKIDQLEVLFQGISEDQIEALKKERVNLKGEFVNIGKKKEIEGLEYLKTLSNKLKKVRSDLREEKFDIDQKRQLQRDLDTLLSQFGGLKLSEKIDLRLHPEKKTDAQRAHQVIRQLKGITDIQKIKEVLRIQLKPEQVDFVSNKRFENYKDLNGGIHNLKDYTTGEMVFYEHGDHWKIVINEELLKSENAGEKLQKQITHELLHVEFENNPALKEYWVNKYTQNPNWNDIKKEFVEQFPNKRPPGFVGPARQGGYTPEEWPDEAVVSELYAITPYKKEGGKLNEIIAKSGISGITPKFLGYAEDSEKEMVQLKTNESKIKFPAQMEGSYDDFLNQINEIKKQIKDYKKFEHSSYIPGMNSLLSAMEGFNNETDEMNERFKKSGSGFLTKTIKERIDIPKKDLEKIKEEIKKMAEGVPNKDIGILRNIWNKSTFLSLEDIFQMGVSMKEFIQRRNKRRVADHAARLGMALFDKIPFIGDFATESSAQKEKAEADEVSEWENRLSNKDVATLYDMLDSMSKNIDPSKDQFKAILRVLSSKGALNWRVQSIWILLSTLQSATGLSVNDESIKGDFNLLRSKIKAAMSEIWDKDEFLNLENKNESGYKSRKEGHIAQIDKSSGNIGGQLESLYLKFKSGRKGEVEPAEYEALIEYAITNGRYNAEKTLFYLVAGMGMGILTPDRGEALDNKSSIFPALDWISISSGCKTTDEWKNLCEKNFKNEFENGMLSDNNSKFKNFYFTTVVNSLGAQQRTIKSVSADKKWDPDWCRAIAPVSNAHVMRIHMAGTSGRIQLTEKHAENTIAGLLQWFEENAKNPAGSWKNNFMERMAAFTMSEAIYAGVAYSADKNFFRSKSIFSNVPLEAGSTNHPDKTAGAMREKILDYTGQFSDGYMEFLKLITDVNRMEIDGGKTLLADIKNFLSRYSSLNSVASGANNLDVIFNSLDTIVKAILSEVPNDVFMARTQKLMEGLQ